MMGSEFTKDELLKYIKVLQSLKDSGIRCEQEISQALKTINEMFFPKQQEFAHTNIFVFVVGREDFNQMIKVFSNTLKRDMSSGTFETSGYTRISSENTRVDIIDVHLISTLDLSSRFRGLYADLIIDKTNGRFNVEELSGIALRKKD